jgi:transposase
VAGASERRRVARPKPCCREKNEDQQCLGRSRERYSGKLHGFTDNLGKPLRFALIAGVAGDPPEAIPLLDTVSMITVQAEIADRAQDSDAIRAWLTEQGAEPAIPPHPARLVPLQGARQGRMPVRQDEAL